MKSVEPTLSQSRSLIVRDGTLKRFSARIAMVFRLWANGLKRELVRRMVAGGSLRMPATTRFCLTWSIRRPSNSLQLTWRTLRKRSQFPRQSWRRCIWAMFRRDTKTVTSRTRASARDSLRWSSTNQKPLLKPMNQRISDIGLIIFN